MDSINNEVQPIVAMEQQEAKTEAVKEEVKATEEVKTDEKKVAEEAPVVA